MNQVGAAPPLLIEELIPLILVIGSCLALFAAYGTRLALAGRARDARTEREHPTVLLGRFPMEAFHWAMRSVADYIVRLRVNPDHLTYLSLAITGATVPLVASGAFTWAAFVLLIGSALDALDGIVARQRSIASDAGEVLDAVIDRYADALPLAGLVLYFRQSAAALVFIMWAWIGSFAVSYVRAKAEAMSIELRGGLMRRQERLLYLGIALLLGPVLPDVVGLPVSRPWTVFIVGGIGFLSNFAAVQLTVRTRQALTQLGRGPSGQSHAE
jgi:CDP-diacylglycerol---glycerol-3-phosphate 3-phosphatidyltransferase